MAGFVLIHGAWHGGWSFDPVAERLRAGGHWVDTPDLPGMGGTEAELRAVTMEAWGRFTVERCKAMRAQSGGPVVLVGHSRGGLVIGEAAEQAPQAIDALVYVCAMMLPAGVSRTDFKDIQEPTPDYDAIIHVQPHGAGTVIDPALAPAIFAQLSPPVAAAQAAARLVAEPTAPRLSPATISEERWGTVPRTYIECTEDRTIPIASQRLMQEMSPGSRVISLPCDHSPFLSCPDALTEALIACIPSPS